MNIAQNASSSKKKKTSLKTIESLIIESFQFQENAKISYELELIKYLFRFDSQLEANINSPYEFKRFYKILDSEVDVYDLSYGHLCIFSTKSVSNVILTIDIINFFLSQKKSFEIITVSDFIKLSFKEKSSTKIQYLIEINVNNISYEEMCIIAPFCNTKFIFQIPGVTIDSKSNVLDQNGNGIMLDAFYKDSILLKQEVASLNEEEFVIIFYDMVFVCSHKNY